MASTQAQTKFVPAKISCYTVRSLLQVAVFPISGLARSYNKVHMKVQELRFSLTHRSEGTCGILCVLAKFKTVTIAIELNSKCPEKCGHTLDADVTFNHELRTAINCIE